MELSWPADLQLTVHSAAGVSLFLACALSSVFSVFDVAPRQVKGESHLVVSIPYVATAPQFRRRGFAKLLLTHIKAMAGH